MTMTKQKRSFQALSGITLGMCQGHFRERM